MIYEVNGGKVEGARLDQLAARMKHHHALNNNIILSVEVFGNKGVVKEAVLKTLVPFFQHWRVRIVIGYRHYLEHIPSIYYQKHAGNKYSLWPHEGGRAHPPLTEVIQKELGMLEEHRRKHQDDGSTSSWKWQQEHMTIWALELYLEHFDDVQIFDLYQEGDLVTNFVCQMIPTAHHTCQHLLTLQNNSAIVANSNSKKQRVSQSFDANRLALAAYKRGLVVGTRRKNKMVVSKIRLQLDQQQQQAKNSTWTKPEYFTCLSPFVQDQLWNTSVAFQRYLWNLHPPSSSSSSEEAESQHRIVFERAVARNKFCDLDTEKVLADPKWVDFLGKRDDESSLESKKQKRTLRNHGRDGAKVTRILRSAQAA
eukprot:CAMPEP_0119005166 /NCGR_PEP_ID=MMETSP1176-20130426/1561_1 /TAXON_ID=265551 /ORGANISM="Synedropsis recta cf, Strain CCMP1620" /LENGTH=366 /DNA_ID=CAMNT_0006956943 /DNA_START=649 /DNA_END=1753 /DNA_ORIENTATION=+